MFNEYRYKTAWCPICRQGAIEFVKEEATRVMFFMLWWMWSRMGWSRRHKHNGGRFSLQIWKSSWAKPRGYSSQRVEKINNIRFIHIFTEFFANNILLKSFSQGLIYILVDFFYLTCPQRKGVTSWSVKVCVFMSYSLIHQYHKQ